MQKWWSYLEKPYLCGRTNIWFMNKIVSFLVVLVLWQTSSFATTADSSSIVIPILRKTTFSQINDSALAMGNLLNTTMDKEYRYLIPDLKDDCQCVEREWWGDGYYVPTDTYIACFIPCICHDYQDGNPGELMENDVIDYELVTYSYSKKIIDQHTLGRSNQVYKMRLSYDEKDSRFVVERGTLTDGHLLYQYKGQDYTFTRHYITIDKHGRIQERQVGNTWTEHEPEAETSVPPVTFSDYIKLFEPWNKPEVSDSLFKSDNQMSLTPKYRDMLPDSLFCNCWPKNLSWSAGRCIETPTFWLCFICVSCYPPKSGYPYTEYLMLVYSKDGIFVRAESILRLSDSDKYDMNEVPQMLREACRRTHNTLFKNE